jgi:hypothetical protein
VRKVIIYSLAVCLTLSNSIIPANAIFGLSKCEKIRKEIVSLELGLQKNLNILKSGMSNTVLIQSKTGERIYKAHTKAQSSLDSIWKLGTNNPQCFTNTQKILIKNQEYWFANTWINLSPSGGKWLIYEVNKYLGIFQR